MIVANGRNSCDQMYQGKGKEVTGCEVQRLREAYTVCIDLECGCNVC